MNSKSFLRNVRSALTVDGNEGMLAMNQRPIIIEMVGLAGAGKSTLRKVLAQRNARIQVAPPPSKAIYLPFLGRDIFLWLPIYLGKYRHSRWFTPQETKLMGYLSTWLPYLRWQAIGKGIVVVLDPGSVYWLSALREFGPEITQSLRYQRWWNEMLFQWTAALEAIIWLDAPDELLLERVLGRDEWHEAKGQPRKQALEYFARYRMWYERVIAAMTGCNGPRVLRFRTDQISPEQMADKVLAVIDLMDFDNQNR